MQGTATSVTPTASQTQQPPARQLVTPALYGYWHIADTPSLPNTDAVNNAMQSALTNTALFSVHSCDSSLLGSTSTVCHQETLEATLIGNPQWQTRQLQLIAREQGHAQALISAYQLYGSACIKQIGGAFACVLFDKQKHLCLAAVDRFSTYPLYYTVRNGQLWVASAASALLAGNPSPQDITAQGLYNFVFFHMVPSPNAIFDHVQKLMAGQALVVEHGEPHTFLHWQPTFKRSQERSEKALQAQLREKLKAAVKAAMPEQPEHTAAFLSGGLDSSTVVGMLAELSEGKKAHAYSIGFSAEGYDEMAYARITAKHFGVELHEYYVTPEDVVEALPTVATSYDEPFGNSSALPAYFCAKVAAQSGVKHLLAGDGGDEFFAGNERYAKQKVFEAYRHIPQFLRGSVLEPVINRIPSKIPMADKARSYIQQANVGLPGRLHTYNFLKRHQPNEIFTDAFIAQINTQVPDQLLQQVYDAPIAATTLDRMLYLDWQFTLADNDIRKVSHMCALAGVTVSYPMLNDALVDFSCTLPDELKLKGQHLRHFYKRALTGWLPDETINKSKQGFGLPFGVWMQTHAPLRDMAYACLLRIKQRPYFRPEFIDHLITLHKDGHAAYYGELIWILTVLELWLAHHEPSA